MPAFFNQGSERTLQSKKKKKVIIFSFLLKLVNHSRYIGKKSVYTIGTLCIEVEFSFAISVNKVTEWLKWLCYKISDQIIWSINLSILVIRKTRIWEWHNHAQSNSIVECISTWKELYITSSLCEKQSLR